MSKGRLIIVVGKSGSGKTKLANEIILTGCMFNDNKSIPSEIWSDNEHSEDLANIVDDPNNTTFYAKNM